MTATANLDIARIKELYDSGLSQREIGQEFGVSAKAISEQMRRAGIPARRTDGNTQPELLLRAALELSGTERKPFSTSAIIVAAWKLAPAFGLRGYEQQYPDSNRVISSIAGKKGLVSRGWLYRTGPNEYRITPSGLRKLGVEPTNEKPEPCKLVVRLAGSSAARKQHEGRRNEIRFMDACKFWSIEEWTVAPRDSVRRIDRELEAAAEREEEGARVLLHLARWMEERFEKHLAMLVSRKKEAS